MVTLRHPFRCHIICLLWQAKGSGNSLGRTALGCLITKGVQLVKAPGLTGAQLQW